jgi:hypothetical protein
MIRTALFVPYTGRRDQLVAAVRLAQSATIVPAAPDSR